MVCIFKKSPSNGYKQYPVVDPGFPRRRKSIFKVLRQSIIWPNFSEISKNMKEIGTRGDASMTPLSPLDPSMETHDVS